jgi:hypothetical protein
MSSYQHRAIVVIGGEDLAEATLTEAEQYDEVLVIARAVPDASDHWLIDGDRAEAAARGRLVRALARLGAHGVRSRRDRRRERSCSTQRRSRALSRRPGDLRLARVGFPCLPSASVRV